MLGSHAAEEMMSSAGSGGGLVTKAQLNLGEKQKCMQHDVVVTLVCFELPRIITKSIPLWSSGNFSS